MSDIEKRLNKYISESGFCSRREADKLIENNRVTINGKLPELGTKVKKGDKVFVDGKPINWMPDNKSDRVYIAYNKPIGITCTTERKVRGNIVDAIKHKERIFPIGRLDKPSEGLIFLTSDGDIVNKILRAENAHEKEYVVTVDKPISERFLSRMAKGVPILGTITNPCQITQVSRCVFKIILTQGLNRQIRRMCEYLGYEVTKLKRIRIMSVDLGGLKPGQYRDLTAQEMDEINRAVAGSSKTAANNGQSVTRKARNYGDSHNAERDHKTKERSAKEHSVKRHKGNEKKQQAQENTETNGKIAIPDKFRFSTNKQKTKNKTGSGGGKKKLSLKR